MIGKINNELTDGGVQDVTPVLALAVWSNVTAVR